MAVPVASDIADGLLPVVVGVGSANEEVFVLYFHILCQCHFKRTGRIAEKGSFTSIFAVRLASYHSRLPSSGLRRLSMRLDFWPKWGQSLRCCRLGDLGQQFGVNYEA